MLAVPGAAAKDVLASLGDALAGKVVIDATNDIQGAGKLHALDELADGAHPVRAFNTLGWENYADPVFDGVPADLFYAAEEGHAKEVADTAHRRHRAQSRSGSAASTPSTSSTRSPGSGSNSPSSASSAADWRSRCSSASNPQGAHFAGRRPARCLAGVNRCRHHAWARHQRPEQGWLKADSAPGTSFPPLLDQT